MPETEIFKQDSGDTKCFDLDLKILRRLIDSEKLEKTPVIVITVVGDTRTAKGTLMSSVNAFLRKEDRSAVDRLSNADMYLHVKGEPQHGSGCRIWDEPIYQTIAGEKVAIILMVAQVSVIEEEKANATKSILAMVSCLSSITIFNVKTELRTKDLYCAKDILAYSCMASQGSHLTITVQKYNGEHEEAECLKNAFEEKNDESEATKTVKETLKRKNIKCFVFTDSGCVRDPEKRPDLNPDFLKEVTDFVKEEFSNDMLVHGQRITGKQLLRHAEELNESIRRTSSCDIKPQHMEKIVKQTKFMLDCEAAFENRMQEATPKDLFSMELLGEMKIDAQRVARKKANELQLSPEVWERVEKHNQNVYGNFKQAAQTIEAAIQPLYLRDFATSQTNQHRSQTSAATNSAALQHPQDETSPSHSSSEQEDIDVLNEAGNTSSKRPKRRRCMRLNQP